MSQKSKHLTSIFDLLLLILLASIWQIAAQSPASKKTAKATPEEWQQLRTRTDRIEKELAKLKEPEWAGVYEDGHYGFSGSLFYVHPQLGFVYRPYVDFFPNDIMDKFDYGETRILEGRVFLQPTRGIFPSDEIFFVQWGDLRFLIPEGDMPHFINVINAGCDQFKTEKHVAEAYFYTRRELRRARLFGTPIVPAQFRDFVFGSPVTATITFVGETIVENPLPDNETYPWRWRKTKVKLNAGYAEGLTTPMVLFATDATGEALQVSIRHVGEHSSDAELTSSVNIETGGPPLPAVGWLVTSRLKKSQYNSFCW